MDTLCIGVDPKKGPPQTALRGPNTSLKKPFRNDRLSSAAATPHGIAACTPSAAVSRLAVGGDVQAFAFVFFADA